MAIKEIKTILHSGLWDDLYEKYYVPPISRWYWNNKPTYFSIKVEDKEMGEYFQPGVLYPVPGEEWPTAPGPRFDELDQPEKFAPGFYWMAITGSCPVYHNGKKFYGGELWPKENNITFWYEYKVIEKEQK